MRQSFVFTDNLLKEAEEATLLFRRVEAMLSWRATLPRRNADKPSDKLGAQSRVLLMIMKFGKPSSL